VRKDGRPESRGRSLDCRNGRRHERVKVGRQKAKGRERLPPTLQNETGTKQSKKIGVLTNGIWERRDGPQRRTFAYHQDAEGPRVAAAGSVRVEAVRGRCLDGAVPGRRKTNLD